MWVLLEALRNQSLDQVKLPASLRTHGWPSVRDLLPNALRHLFYRSDADGLVVLADSDHTPLHTPKHEEPGCYDPACRICQLRAVGRQTIAELHGQIQGRVLRVALAIAVPAIEAWWRCGLDTHATEQSWARSLPRGPFPFSRRDLKKVAYGTDRPSLPLSTMKMVESARRLTADLPLLERHFPMGFGAFATEFRAW